MLVCVSTSQPSAAWLLQSAVPVAHVNVHLLAEQMGVAAVAVQALPQPPQLATSVVVWVSQPLLASPSQSAYPLLQVNPQSPLMHAVVALAALGHGSQLGPPQP